MALFFFGTATGIFLMIPLGLWNFKKREDV